MQKSMILSFFSDSIINGFKIEYQINNNVFMSSVTCREPDSVAQWAETQCTPTGTVCRKSRGSLPGRPVDFVFGFQGRML